MIIMVVVTQNRIEKHLS